LREGFGGLGGFDQTAGEIFLDIQVSRIHAGGAAQSVESRVDLASQRGRMREAQLHATIIRIQRRRALQGVQTIHAVGPVKMQLIHPGDNEKQHDETDAHSPGGGSGAGEPAQGRKHASIRARFLLCFRRLGV